mgnify:CR=1 FL=1
MHCRSLPVLVLLDLLEEVFDRCRDVDLQVLGNLVDDLLGLSLNHLDIRCRNRLWCLSRLLKSF